MDLKNEDKTHSCQLLVALKHREFWVKLRSEKYPSKHRTMDMPDVLDTDRIRENVARMRDRKFSLVVNSSINETLSRTLLTSLTTLFTCVVIWVMGTGVLRTFAFALVAGVLVGTYSSIFVASPLLVSLHDRFAAAKRRAGARA